MSNTKLFFLSALFLVQLQLTAQKTEEIPVPPADTIIERVINRHDPGGRWPQFSGEMHLSTIFPNDGVTEEDLLLDNERSVYQSVMYDHDRQIVKGIQEGKVFQSVNGQIGLSPEIIDKYELSEEKVRWMSEHHRSHFGLPMYLKEKAGVPASVEKVSFAGKECFQLRFTPPAGEDSGPYFTSAVSLFVDPATSLMEGMLYEKNTGKENEGVYVLFNKTIEIDGILVPQVKTYYHRSDDSYWFTDIFHPTPRISHLAREAEEQAIRKVLDEETQYFYARDHNKWSGCWSHQPDVFYAFSSRNDFVMKKGWQEVNEHIKNYMRDYPDPHSPPIERSNFVYHLQHNLAWVYFDNREGDLYGKQQRVLRKENGRWKLINVTAFDESSYQE